MAWADRTRAELSASGETLRRRKSWEVEELTPQELQISLHVARGMTNREVGTALFLSHKTIEFHLGRIYRKLKMHSRAELISRFARQAEEAKSHRLPSNETGAPSEPRSRSRDSERYSSVPRSTAGRISAATPPPTLRRHCRPAS